MDNAVTAGTSTQSGRTQAANADLFADDDDKKTGKSTGEYVPNLLAQRYAVFSNPKVSIFIIYSYITVEFII